MADFCLVTNLMGAGRQQLWPAPSSLVVLMLDQIFSLVFYPFQLDPVLYCCGFSLVLGIFGLVRRFIIGDFDFKK